MTIYLDHNAGSPLRECARRAIVGVIEAGGANPASVHLEGQHARATLERARAALAALISASPRQVVFTSGGTEANNMAIHAGATISRRRRIITSSIEHSSLLAPIARMERDGFEVVRIVPDGEGRIDPRRILEALDSGCALVALGLANAEVGAVQDLTAIAAGAAACGALLHVDAAQALGRLAVSVERLGCDLMALSGHKLGAPAGIGALYVRHPQRFVPLLTGGPQEHGLRAGTPNLLGAAALGAVAEELTVCAAQEQARMTRMRAVMRAHLADAIPGIGFNGPGEGGLPNTLNCTFPAVKGETMLIALDLEGVRVSMGSACAAGSVEPSHVLLAMGRSAAQARSSLRLSLGPQTTLAEVEEASRIIARVWSVVIRHEDGAEVAA